MSSKACRSRVTVLFVASTFALFFMAFSPFDFLSAYAKECCLALAMVATTVLLIRGEVDLGNGWEGRAKEGDGTWVGVSKISTSDDDVVGLG